MIELASLYGRPSVGALGGEVLFGARRGARRGTLVQVHHFQFDQPLLRQRDYAEQQ